MSNQIRTPTKFVEIALFGLSGDPPTGESGHIGIVQHLVESGKFSEIWVCPVYKHMFSAKSGLQPFEHRMMMCELAFCPLSSVYCEVKVVPYEKTVFQNVLAKSSDPTASIRVGTIDIIQFIQRQFLDQTVDTNISNNKKSREVLKLHLVLGSDTFRDLASGKWKSSVM